MKNVEGLNLVNEKQLSLLTNIPIRTLQYYRKANKGFPYVMIGRKIFYRLSDIRSWIKDHTKHTSPLTNR